MNKWMMTGVPPFLGNLQLFGGNWMINFHVGLSVNDINGGTPKLMVYSL